MTWLNLFVLGLLGAMTATPLHGAAVAEPAAASPPAAQTNSPVETEFRTLQADDDAAQAEVDKWTRENSAAKAGGLSATELEKRISERLASVGKAYEDFLTRHPGHARAHLAYGCFLNDRQNELGAQAEWEKALALDPSNPDVYNNLAGRYTESGPANKAFEFYAKAIELNPNQPLYYHNFATTVYVLRKRAAAYYHFDERQVFAKIIQLYSNSARLEPTNFAYATDLAQTYYSMRPFPTESALGAWSNTLQTASTQLEREEVYIHLARVQMLAGRLSQARSLLEPVTNADHFLLKSNLLHNLERREKPGGEQATEVMQTR